MKIRIHVTKEILERSKMCDSDPGTNCAIALAVRDIFPGARVAYDTIYPFFSDEGSIGDGLLLPGKASKFITDFDHKDAWERMRMTPVYFEIDVPDSIIDRIGIEEVNRILSESTTLERV